MMEELKKRFDSFIFHGQKRKHENEDQFFLDFQGGKASCLGLCDILHKKIITLGMKELDELPPGEI